MNWRTDKPTADIIVALISDGGGYNVLYRRDDGKYVNRYDELPYSIIEKWADLKEDERVTDCHQLEEEINRCMQHFSVDQNLCVLNKDGADITPADIDTIARHFAKWGAEHLKTK